MDKDKIKLIVEVDKKILFKGFEQPLTEEERMTLIRAIGNGKSYSDSKDAISRSDLKEIIIDPLNVNDAGKNDWYEGYYTAKNEDVYYIDNAPALNLEEHSFIEGYKKGCEEGKRCYERPKSEWIAREDMDYLDENKVVHKHFQCKECGFIHDFIDGHTSQYNFCPQCGYRLEGGVE